MTLALTVGLTAWAPAGEQPAGQAPPSAARPEGLQDKDFEKHVAPAEIAEALSSLEAEQLADVAAKLADGERALGRPHKGLSAQQAANLAAMRAAQQRSREAAERLAKLAAQHKMQALAAKAAALKKVAAKSRDTKEDVCVSIADTTPEAFAQLREIRQRIETARTLGLKKDLDSIESEAAEFGELKDSHREAVKKMVAQARASMPAEPLEDADAMSKLISQSRSLVGDNSNMFTYYITNTTRQTQRFSLHGSGREYTLAAGKRGQYTANRNRQNYIMLFYYGAISPAPTRPGTLAIDTTGGLTKKRFNFGSGYYQIKPSGSSYTFGY